MHVQKNFLISHNKQISKRKEREREPAKRKETILHIKKDKKVKSLTEVYQVLLFWQAGRAYGAVSYCLQPTTTQIRWEKKGEKVSNLKQKPLLQIHVKFQCTP